MMHDDVYRARAFNSLAPRLEALLTVLRTNRQAQAHSHYQYAVTLNREESADASWLSWPTNQAHYDVQRTD